MMHRPLLILQMKAEKSILGFGHDEVGGELMKRWKLPKIHEESVRYHHTPAKSPSFKKEAATINIANSIAQNLLLGSSGELLDSKIKKESLEILDIKPGETFLKIREEVQEQYQNTVQTFLQTSS